MKLLTLGVYRRLIRLLAEGFTTSEGISQELSNVYTASPQGIEEALSVLEEDGFAKRLGEKAWRPTGLAYLFYEVIRLRD